MAHESTELFILVLLIFRLCWGIWGSNTARFSRFVHEWSGIINYMKNGIPEYVQPGHNPLGALMVVALHWPPSHLKSAQGILPPMKTASAPTATSTIWFQNILGSHHAENPPQLFQAARRIVRHSYRRRRRIPRVQKEKPRPPDDNRLQIHQKQNLNPLCKQNRAYRRIIGCHACRSRHPAPVLKPDINAV